MNLVPSSTGTLAPPGAGLGWGAVGTAGETGESAIRYAGATIGNWAFGFIDVAIAAVLDPFAVFCRRCRLAGFRPSSRLSHSRNVSWAISTPIALSPPTSEPTDSPAWQRRSSSSRCGCNWAVAWLRGQRARATASTRLDGRTDGRLEWVGCDMGVNGEQYALRSGSAMGAVWVPSKRKRLDVGVLTYFFLLFLLSELSSIFGFVVGWIIGMVDPLRFYSVHGVGSFHLWSLFESLDFESLVSRWSGSVDFPVRFWSFELNLISGGRGC